jgi:hypothetical protein
VKKRVLLYVACRSEIVGLKNRYLGKSTTATCDTLASGTKIMSRMRVIFAIGVIAIPDFPVQRPVSYSLHPTSGSAPDPP